MKRTPRSASRRASKQFAANVPGFRDSGPVSAANQNNIHGLKDAVMKEDATRQRNPNAAQALGLLRTALLAPVGKAGHTSLTRATQDFAANKWRRLESSSISAWPDDATTKALTLGRISKENHQS